jgi:hypothetical protein
MYRLSRDGPLLRRMRLGQSPVVPVQIRWIAASQATIAEALFSYRLDGLAANTHRGTMLPHVFRLEVSGFSQGFQGPFRYFAAFWTIEITTEFLFVGIAPASPMRVLFKPFDGGYLSVDIHRRDDQSFGSLVRGRLPNQAAFIFMEDGFLLRSSSERHRL